MRAPRLIYFLRPTGQPGPVKIGSTRAHRLARRFAEIEKHSPLPLEIAVVIEADMHIEFKLHGFFVQQRTHYEWFSASDRLSKLIDDLRAGVPIAEAIDLSSTPIGRRIPAKAAA